MHRRKHARVEPLRITARARTRRTTRTLPSDLLREQRRWAARHLLPGQTMPGLFPLGRPTPRLPRHGVSAGAKAVEPAFQFMRFLFVLRLGYGSNDGRRLSGDQGGHFRATIFRACSAPTLEARSRLYRTHTHHASSTTHLFTPTHATPLRTRTHAHIPCTQMRWLSSCSQLVRDDSIQVFDGASEFIFSFRYFFKERGPP